jgi:hypothetical protein
MCPLATSEIADSQNNFCTFCLLGRLLVLFGSITITSGFCVSLCKPDAWCISKSAETSTAESIFLASLCAQRRLLVHWHNRHHSRWNNHSHSHLCHYLSSRIPQGISGHQYSKQPFYPKQYQNEESYTTGRLRSQSEGRQHRLQTGGCNSKLVNIRALSVNSRGRRRTFSPSLGPTRH